MRNSTAWLTALAVLFGVTGALLAQPPGRRDGPPRRFDRGGPAGLERVVDELRLSERNQELARAAVRTYEDDSRRLAELTASSLVLKMREILGPEEAKKFKEATDAARSRSGRDFGRSLGSNDVIERILSFDKKKVGKVTAEDLPERMQHLIAQGDLNKDSALDREEIKKLADELSKEQRSGGRDGRGPPGRGGRDGAANGLTLRTVERAVDELRLSGATKEKAAEAVKSHQESVRRLTELARADLQLKMADVLSEQELKKFKEGLDRQPGFSDRPAFDRDGRPPFGPPGRFPPRRP